MPESLSESGTVPASPQGHSPDPHNTTDGECRALCPPPSPSCTPTPTGSQGPTTTVVGNAEALIQRIWGQDPRSLHPKQDAEVRTRAVLRPARALPSPAGPAGCRLPLRPAEPPSQAPSSSLARSLVKRIGFPKNTEEAHARWERSQCDMYNAKGDTPLRRETASDRGPFQSLLWAPANIQTLRPERTFAECRKAGPRCT